MCACGVESYPVLHGKMATKLLECIVDEYELLYRVVPPSAVVVLGIVFMALRICAWVRESVAPLLTLATRGDDEILQMIPVIYRDSVSRVLHQ